MTSWYVTSDDDANATSLVSDTDDETSHDTITTTITTTTTISRDDDDDASSIISLGRESVGSFPRQDSVTSSSVNARKNVVRVENEDDRRRDPGAQQQQRDWVSQERPFLSQTAPLHSAPAAYEEGKNRPKKNVRLAGLSEPSSSSSSDASTEETSTSESGEETYRSRRSLRSQKSTNDARERLRHPRVSFREFEDSNFDDDDDDEEEEEEEENDADEDKESGVPVEASQAAATAAPSKTSRAERRHRSASSGWIQNLHGNDKNNSERPFDSLAEIRGTQLPVSADDRKQREHPPLYDPLERMPSFPPGTQFLESFSDSTFSLGSSFDGTDTKNYLFQRVNGGGGDKPQQGGRVPDGGGGPLKSSGQNGGGGLRFVDVLSMEMPLGSAIASSLGNEHDTRGYQRSVPVGLRVPNHVIQHMVQGTRLTLSTELVRRHAKPFVSFGIPYLRPATAKRINIALYFLLLSLLVKLCYIAVPMTQMDVGATLFIIPLEVLATIFGYYALKLASLLIMTLYLISIISQDSILALVVTHFDSMFSQATAAGHGLGVAIGQASLTVLALGISAYGLFIIPRCWFLVRQDVAELATQIPLERLHEDLDPHPFVFWYFDIPTNRRKQPK